MMRDSFPSNCTSCGKKFQPGDKFFYDMLDDDPTLDDICESCADSITMLACETIPMTEYWKQERKLDVFQARTVNDLTKALVKKIGAENTVSPPAKILHTQIEIGITEFLFAHVVEFGRYQGPNSQGEPHEPMVDSGTTEPQ